MRCAAISLSSFLKMKDLDESLFLFFHPSGADVSRAWPAHADVMGERLGETLWVLVLWIPSTSAEGESRDLFICGLQRVGKRMKVRCLAK